MPRGRAASARASLEQVDGPSAWRGSDLKLTPARWQRRFTAADVEELERVVSRLEGRDLVTVTQEEARIEVCIKFTVFNIT